MSVFRFDFWRPSWILAINGKPGRGFFGTFTWAITRLSRTTVRSLALTLTLKY